MDLPFDGAISQYFQKDAPEQIRAQINGRKKGKVMSSDYPYRDLWDRKEYEKDLARLQIELVKCQADIKATGKRVALVFEGRDAAGKGGTIKRLRENLNPRGARVVALSKPTDQEASQWYFQRYIQHLPAAGEIIFFDRSWYNRGVVEKVFGFCSPAERETWFRQVGPFEQMLFDEGITLIKFWLNVGRAEQLRRFLSREKDPLKQWKLSRIDVDGLRHWDAYSQAIEQTLRRSESSFAPWQVILADDKKRARVAAIRTLLSQIDYKGKDAKVVQMPDPKITGGPELWHG